MRYAEMAYYFPGSFTPRTYEEALYLLLNVETARAIEVTNIADGVAIGEGRATVPNEWIDLLTDDPVERAKWRLREFRKE